MKKFIWVGNWHDVDTSQYLYEILRAEKTEIIGTEDLLIEDVIQKKRTW